MTSYIPINEFQQDEKVLVITKDNYTLEGRIIRITPYKEVYGILSVLTDSTKELVVVQKTNKVSKLS